MIDLRSHLLPVRDQGQRGTCVAFAATAGHELLCNDGVELCVEFLHWAAKQRDGLPASEEGTTLDAAGSSLADLGQPPEELWPYDDTRDQTLQTYRPEPTVVKAAYDRCLNGSEEIDRSPQSILGVLQSGNAILLGVVLSRNWYYLSTDARIRMPAPGEPFFAGHAVLVAGYLPELDGVEDHFIIRNSWGAAWGHNGYAYLPFSYVDIYGIAAYRLGL